MKFEEAIINDKRTYISSYWSVIKYSQILIFTFYTNDDYNDRLLKIALFFNSMSLFITINSLFFNDSSMSHIYYEKGKYEFIYEIPKIILSSIITFIIKFTMSFLCLTHDKIKDLKKNENLEEINEKISKIYSCLKIKLVIFYVLLFILNCFYIYYTSIFCSVYNNTQLHLIKDSLLSFTISLIVPFLLVFFSTFLRLIALKKNIKILYNISKIIKLIS